MLEGKNPGLAIKDLGNSKQLVFCRQRPGRDAVKESAEWNSAQDEARSDCPEQGAQSQAAGD